MAKSPDYYTRGSIECWDFIRDQQLNYHLGCAIKYICRAGHKYSKVRKSERHILTRFWDSINFWRRSSQLQREELSKLSMKADDLKKAIHYLENELKNTPHDSIGSSKRVPGRLQSASIWEEWKEWEADPEMFDR